MQASASGGRGNHPEVRRGINRVLIALAVAVAVGETAQCEGAD